MRGYAIGLILSLIFFISLLATLSDYGVHEDNLFHFLRGQYFLERFKGREAFDLPAGGQTSPIFFVPGQRISLYKPDPSEPLLSPPRPFEKQVRELTGRAKAVRTSFYKHNSWGANAWEIPDQGHPAVSDILMALSNRILYERLGLFNDIEAYHVYIALVSAATLFFVYLFTRSAFGEMPALFASTTLALFPLYFAESHFNPKDPVQMGFFTASLVSLYFFVTKNRSHGWFIAFLLSSFLALGTKWNIASLPFIFLPWFFLLLWKKGQIRHHFPIRVLLLYGFLAVTVPFLLLIVAWPFLWKDTLPKLIDTFAFYKELAVLDPRIDAPPPFTLPLGFNPTPILRAITTTPPIALVLFAIGLLAIVFRKTQSDFKEEWLLLLWLLIPLLRVSRQLADTAGSNRQFIEYLPAFAIIAGIGGAFAAEKLMVRFPRIRPRYFMIGTLAVYFLVLISTIVRFHPNENIYFNFLAGGPSGAKKSGLYSWQASYGNVYRQGALWLNRNAWQDAKIAYLDGTMLALSPLWLRDDLYIGSYFSGFEQKGEYVVSLVYPVPPAIFAYNYLDRFLTPVHEVVVDGEAVLRIWQNSDAYVKEEFREQEALTGMFDIFKSELPKGRAFEIRLVGKRNVTRLLFEDAKDCAGRVGGLWSIVHDGKEQFIVPGQSRNNGKIVIDFPAEPTDKIRFWDIEGDSCLYNATLDALYASHERPGL